MFSLDFKNLIENYIDGYNLTTFNRDKWLCSYQSLVKSCSCDDCSVGVRLYKDVNNLLTLKFTHIYLEQEYLFEWGYLICKYSEIIECYGRHHQTYGTDYIIQSENIEIMIEKFMGYLSRMDTLLKIFTKKEALGFIPLLLFLSVYSTEILIDSI